MDLLSDIARFKERQNIILEGFDPVSAGGFTQVPNCVLRDKQLSFLAKVVYSMLLSYAWHNNLVFPGQDRLAEEVGTSQQSVSRGIVELEKAGYLEVRHRGQGLTNQYTLRHTVKQKRKK